jgi:hypothetical protein
MQRVEIWRAVYAKDHRLAVDHELLAAVLQCGFDDPGKRLVQPWLFLVKRRTS